MERRLLFACINQSVLGPELPVNSGLAMKGHRPFTSTCLGIGGMPRSWSLMSEMSKSMEMRPTFRF